MTFEEIEELAPILFSIKMIYQELDSDLRSLASWLREE